MVPEPIHKPSYVADLERSYGGPSQAAFGSAVFFEPDTDPEKLEKNALAKYQHFCGDTWTRFGEENWLGNWNQVYARETKSQCDIVAELESLEDRDARRSASMLLENAEAHGALRKALDDAQVSEVRVFRIGDGGAMSGLLIASLRPEGAVYLVFLLD